MKFLKGVLISAAWAISACATHPSSPQTAPKPAPTSNCPAGAAFPQGESEQNSVARGSDPSSRALELGQRISAVMNHYGDLSKIPAGCDSGDMEACWVAGAMYSQQAKVGDKEQLTTARRYLRKACTANIDFACSSLGDVERRLAALSP